MAFILSCKPGEDGPDAIIGNSISVPNEVTTVQTSLEFDSDWTLENQASWFVVTPMRGSAGTANLTISILETNSGLKERAGNFAVTVNGTETLYYVFQDGTPGFSITTDSYTVTSEEQTFSFSVEGNVKYEAVPDVDWMTVNSVQYDSNSVQYDSTLLEDNHTYSKYMTSVVSLSIQANDGEIREGHITLTGEDGVTTATITVEQIGSLVADYGRTFLRRSLVLRFTGTWCPNCPNMNQALEIAEKNDPDHIVAMSMHNLTSNSHLAFANCNAFIALFGVSSYPRGFVNNYGEVENITNPSILTAVFEGLAEEAVSDLPSNTVIGGVTRLEKDTVYADISIASKEAGLYALNAFLLEDGLVYPQEGGSEDYVHDNVIRIEMTDNLMGDNVSLEANGTYVTQLKVPVPSSVENTDNLHVVVYTTYRGTFTGSVSNVLYGNFGTVVDNVVNIPINTLVNYAYED